MWGPRLYAYPQATRINGVKCQPVLKPSYGLREVRPAILDMAGQPGASFLSRARASPCLLTPEYLSSKQLLRLCFVHKLVLHRNI